MLVDFEVIENKLIFNKCLVCNNTNFKVFKHYVGHQGYIKCVLCNTISFVSEILKFYKNKMEQKEKNEILLNHIEQLEKTIDIGEEHLSEVEFKEYCDYIYSCIAILRTKIKKK